MTMRAGDDETELARAIVMYEAMLAKVDADFAQINNEYLASRGEIAAKIAALTRDLGRRLGIPDEELVGFRPTPETIPAFLEREKPRHLRRIDLRRITEGPIIDDKK